jgi:hypothetical protein
MNSNDLSADPRTPSPPFGYSQLCTHSREQQLHIVAEFHAHKIRPARIAYRVGIDIAFIEELIAGETEPVRFKNMGAFYRTQRYAKRMNDSSRRKGVVQYELQQKIDSEFHREVDL